MNTYPKVKAAKALPNKKIEVIFDNRVRKIYDCSSILREKSFKPLQNKAFFKNLHVDPSGYGVSWNDEIDLSESELWIKGTVRTA